MMSRKSSSGDSRVATSTAGGWREGFASISRRVSVLAGTPWAFALAVGVVVGWALTGPLFGYSSTWQLIINTGTTIVTFLMVFLIQNSQNHESRALELKLDELLHGVTGARNRLIDLENLSEAELDELQEEFERLRTDGRDRGRRKTRVAATNRSR